MNKWHKIGLTVGMGTAVVATAHVANNLIFKSATKNNYSNRRIRQTYQWKFGNIAYTVYGSGTPLLLVHDLNSYSSLNEWENVLKKFAKKHTVYAIDLLGCGQSDKPNITYTTYMYTQLLNDFVVNVIRKKTDVIATGSSAPMVIMAAYNNRVIFDRVILVSPQSVKNALVVPDKKSNVRRLLLNCPVFGTSLYNIFMRKSNIARIMNNSFASKKIPSDIVNACYENAHLTGSSAKYLFTSTECHYTTVSISKALSELDLSIFIINGMKGNQETIDEYLSINPAIEVYKIQDSKNLPHVEQPAEFVRQAEIFLN